MSDKEALYNPKNIEAKWWKFWIDGKWFEADNESDKESYTILIPPPNVTARLHMGHGLNNTIQDILVRWKRMKGFNCLWLPGTDHAGIATQMMVEKALEEQGTSRKELGREKFVERCMQWKDEHGGTIIEQLKRLGCSCDWEREAYTMSPELSKAVRKIFVDLYNDGLIYRGERLVNWDPVLETAISDDEVESKEENGKLWYIQYEVENSKEEYITIATTRPETMFGDSAVAIHPEDERFQHLLGKKVRIPLTSRYIPIIADSYVKKEFGTGCVKISPAHDFNDFEMAQRHNLPLPNMFDEKARLNDTCPKDFVGLERFKARKKVVDSLEKEGLLEKIEKHKHTIPYSERTKVVVEPRLSKQWYVRMEKLVEPAIEYAKKGELNFYPELWRKTYFHWLENIQDWCISRQLWWGHRIPIWYCQSCGEVHTGIEDPTKCSKCGSSDLQQDEDVLDTWFSSWLWPISPLGWPEDSKDLEKFFPSNVIVSAPEIIFLWMARMIIAGHYVKGKLAFKDMYFNSVICDKQGRKFSKTLGNGIDPLEVIEDKGADATRFTCVSLAPLGGRVRLDVEDFSNGFKFVNKIWNAYRFLKQKWDEESSIAELDLKKINLPSKWLLQEFYLATKNIEDHLENYRIHEACRDLYHFIWSSFCDWSLETAKVDFEGKDKESTLATLHYVFEGLLRLSAPFIPFVSEEIWQSMPPSKMWDRPESLVIASFPKLKKIPSFEKEAQDWDWIRSMISGVRSIRTQAGIPPKQKLNVLVKCTKDRVQLVQDSDSWIRVMTHAESLKVDVDAKAPKQSLTATGKGWTVYVPVGDLLDVSKEKERLQRELSRIQKVIEGLEKKISSPNFVQRAPSDVVEATKAQLQNMQSQKEVLEGNLRSLGL